MAKHDNRLFLAFPAETLASPLKKLQQRLDLPGRRIPPHQLHLTLHFLGQCTPEQQTSLLQQLDRLPLPALELVLDRLGCFPRAGVVWLGPSRPPAALMALADTVELKCRAPGVGKPHKAYRPHITLFRHCTTAALPAIPSMHYRPEALCLYRSTLTDQGPEYHCLKRWELKRE
ncbi:RNA 2',3'-cyclic phosphodiesterase [Oceanimonas pelagia]|uniref:RNA 2',3'-cyclic phosphodiesterase n=1 Tax=Oceanimonas pelagia TaxID=3028314 RepID=A0AA50KN96_9GAMM|nr:RNA 2',3'-cyclic phosphodiesterase [Oceanimonas pelagia]WMC10221.1 RNA 2',3'-cyclic phosphodiesterase [Oceanimonas pelagia]